jgi:phosphoenolpyruvate carboxykinase (GTP)
METTSWEHGVFSASILGSETTAAATGTAGAVRRDPMAMLPFCGYNMADYFAHWLSFSKRSNKLPKIFVVNWFKKDDSGKFIWPGFGDNFRVIKWMLGRINGSVDAVETPLGMMPKKGSIDTSGLNISDERYDELFEISAEQWAKELNEAEKFYEQFGGKIPNALIDQLKMLRAKLTQ